MRFYFNYLKEITDILEETGVLKKEYRGFVRWNENEWMNKY